MLDVTQRGQRRRWRRYACVTVFPLMIQARGATCGNKSSRVTLADHASVTLSQNRTCGPRIRLLKNMIPMFGRDAEPQPYTGSSRQDPVGRTNSSEEP
jgi:hypothetical protein